ncbi:receptor-transporting protein 3-like [Lampris incognitus]|uniref:receptor-transporting protein 3-like n=1 Tax=Lampris incognitus TaxID=2546036 RepID=UPI0024B4EE48|nr:receptor-transporting protein 3-like [Lampris incognitus]
MDIQNWIHIFETKIMELEREDHWTLEYDDSIEPDSAINGWKPYIKNSTARFACSMCSRTWPSNRVMVLFHMRLIEAEGTVKVRCFRQNCKRCTNAPMVNPSFSTENINIFLEKLMEKIRIKCYHEDLGPVNRDFIHETVRNPHEPKHCEACIKGICTRN